MELPQRRRRDETVRVAGFDIWRGRWVAVVVEGGLVERVLVAARFAEALEELAEVAAIGVDVPIGLPEPGAQRPSDLLARRYVGRRWPSVFLTPSLDLLEAPSHAGANALARAEGRHGVSAQAYALRTRILEVQPVAERDARVHEVHPEVSFVRANGDRPLAWPKASWNGHHLRRRILEDHGLSLPADLGPAGAAGAGDILDAAIVAWSAARIAAGEAICMPPGSPRVGAIWS